MCELTLLVLSDTHLLEATQAPLPAPSRKCTLGRELLERAVRDAQRRGGFDAVAVMGDMTEDGTAPGAERDLAALEQTLYEMAGDVPRLVIPGNHDPDPDVVLSVFDDLPGLHEIGGYRFFTFVDRWDEEDVGRRPPEQMERFRRVAAGSSDSPLIVLQHNPLHPPIEEEYPFILARREEVMDAYSEAGVLLSLSAHYHPGQELSESGGVRYWTSPALCESPFRYALIHMHGTDVRVEEVALRLPETAALRDVHAHTHYAYCAENVTPEEVIRRAKLFGLAGQCLTEHADQLFLTEKEHRSGLVYEDPDYWNRELPPQARRMPTYRREMEPLRDDFVKLGMEIELDLEGRPAIPPRERTGWDLQLGAVHWLPEDLGAHTRGEINRGYMENLRALLEADIDVLAHPFRYFHARELTPPRDLYETIVDLLVESDTAAEMNFHHNEPDPEFFALCIERGVKIAPGSDAHRLSEVADFHPHLELIRRAAGRQDVSDLLFDRPWRTDHRIPLGR